MTTISDLPKKNRGANEGKVDKRFGDQALCTYETFFSDLITTASLFIPVKQLAVDEVGMLRCDAWIE